MLTPALHPQPRASPQADIHPLMEQRRKVVSLRRRD
jgi:hypothetical protein